MAKWNEVLRIEKHLGNKSEVYRRRDIAVKIQNLKAEIRENSKPDTLGSFPSDFGFCLSG
jgi:hypothetical protein